MKNIDFKKLLVLLVVIVVVILAIFGVLKLIQRASGPNKETEEKIEALIKDYYSNLSYGYATIYNGVDFIFDTDKADYKNLNPGSVIEAAIKYATVNNKNLAVNTNVNEFFTNNTKKEGIAYNAKTIQECVKILFDQDLALTDYFADANYLYDYYYIEEYDAFVKTRSSATDVSNQNASIDVYVIESKKSKNTIVTKIAIGYVYHVSSKYSYSKDKNGTTVLAKDLEELKFPTDKVDEFKQYYITTKKVDDRYVFEKIEKA